MLLLQALEALVLVLLYLRLKLVSALVPQHLNLLFLHKVHEEVSMVEKAEVT